LLLLLLLLHPFNLILLLLLLVLLLLLLLLSGVPNKTLTYTQAALLMLATAEQRHAAVVARTGAVPLLVELAREALPPTTRELSAALLSVLSRCQDVQPDIVAAGGVQALSK
jgi:hypothetical protein